MVGHLFDSVQILKIDIHTQIICKGLISREKSNLTKVILKKASTINSTNTNCAFPINSKLVLMSDLKFGDMRLSLLDLSPLLEEASRSFQLCLEIRALELSLIHLDTAHAHMLQLIQTNFRMLRTKLDLLKQKIDEKNSDLGDLVGGSYFKADKIQNSFEANKQVCAFLTSCIRTGKPNGVVATFVKEWFSPINLAALETSVMQTLESLVRVETSTIYPLLTRVQLLAERICNRRKSFHWRRFNLVSTSIDNVPILLLTLKKIIFLHRLITDELADSHKLMSGCLRAFSFWHASDGKGIGEISANEATNTGGGTLDATPPSAAVLAEAADILYNGEFPIALGQFELILASTGKGLKKGYFPWMCCEREADGCLKPLVSEMQQELIKIRGLVRERMETDIIPKLETKVHDVHVNDVQRAKDAKALYWCGSTDMHAFAVMGDRMWRGDWVSGWEYLPGPYLERGFGLNFDAFGCKVVGVLGEEELLFWDGSETPALSLCLGGGEIEQKGISQQNAIVNVVFIDVGVLAVIRRSQVEICDISLVWRNLNKKRKEVQFEAVGDDTQSFELKTPDRLSSESDTEYMTPISSFSQRFRVLFEREGAIEEDSVQDYAADTPIVRGFNSASSALGFR